MLFKINQNAGQPIYLQLVRQIRHAIDIGVLQHGDLLPGIRTLAVELVVSHNTVAKAYSELEHAGLLELRQGSGAYVAARRSTKSRSDKVRAAQQKIQDVVNCLQAGGFSEDEIRRLFEAHLLNPASSKEKA
jgi:GntR family transcriptional regulator